MKKIININQVFSSIAREYDRMNNVISLGTHKHYKKIAIRKLEISAGERVLDLASGTGDLTGMISADYDVKIVSVDANREMLQVGKNQNPNQKQVISWAEKLPFKNDLFHKIIIGFGIRNFRSNDEVFLELYRIMQNKGKLVILEFGQPTLGIFRFFRDIYLKYIIPIISKLITNKYSEYKYLASSVSEFPNQDNIVEKLRNSGFECHYKNFIFGAITIYDCNK